MTEYAGYLFISILLLRTSITAINFLFVRVVQRAPLKEDNSLKLSLLIPARDEEGNIANLLGDIAKLKNRPFEVIVYNDNSSDSTSAVVSSFFDKIGELKLIESNNHMPPPGWLGKNNACHNLALASTGNYLLFIDADVRLEEGFIERYAGYAIGSQLSLLSLFPKQIMESRGSEITTPIMNWILLSLLPLPLVRYCSWSSFSAANGQFMLFNREDYLKMLPHSKFRRSMAEDIEIARYYKNSKKRVATLTADNSVKCKMYGNFNEAVNGFSKNVLFFFGNSLFFTFLFTILTTLTPLYLLLFNGFIEFVASISLILILTMLYSLTSYQSVYKNILNRIVHQIVYLYIVICALKAKTKRELLWKGRNIY